MPIPTPPCGGGEENDRGKALEEFFVNNGISCLNVGAVPTFNQGERSSIIDITLRNKHADWIEVLEWQVKEEGSLSDHKIIEYSINKFEPFKQSFRNFKKADWSRFMHLQQQLTLL
jgi:hypothetical protein